MSQKTYYCYFVKHHVGIKVNLICITGRNSIGKACISRNGEKKFCYHGPTIVFHPNRKFICRKTTLPMLKNSFDSFQLLRILNFFKNYLPKT